MERENVKIMCMFAIAGILCIVDLFPKKGVLMDTLISLGVPLIVLAVLAVLVAFIAGICFGEKRMQKEQDRHVRNLTDELRLVKDRMHESISQLNRTTNTIIASIVRSNSDGSELDSLAVAQLRRRVTANEMPPLDWDSGSDRNPRNWGHYVSHPDEHGYVTPFGLTDDPVIAAQWRRAGQLILGIPTVDENGNRVPGERPMHFRHETDGRLEPPDIDLEL